MNYPIYCPKCVASDGLMVSLDNLVCPQCSTKYYILQNGLVPEGNGNYEFSTCKKCGWGRYVYHSFMVSDGHDDVDWDSEEWCENPNCESNLPTKFVETNTEFGRVKVEDNKKESKIL